LDGCGSGHNPWGTARGAGWTSSPDWSAFGLNSVTYSKVQDLEKNLTKFEALKSENANLKTLT
jgi:hypothetical protein